MKVALAMVGLERGQLTILMFSLHLWVRLELYTGLHNSHRGVCESHVTYILDYQVLIKSRYLLKSYNLLQRKMTFQIYVVINQYLVLEK